MSVDYKALKKGGFMRQKQKDCFSMRLKSVGGKFTAEQLLTVQRIAKEFGAGYVHLTSRQGIEIPFIKLQDIDTVKEELLKGGVEVGVCGARVRTITACQGNEVCPSGLINTASLAKKIDEKFAGKELPHKFKFGLTGCHNNCLKAEENDVGIKGGMYPTWNKESCIYCGVCQVTCRDKAITVDKTNRTVTIDRSKCVYCGRCVKSCPTNAWQGEAGFIISFGGLYGNRIAVGENVLPIVFKEDQVMQILETALNYFDKHAKPSERFRNMLDRIGWNEFKTEMESLV